MAHLWCLTEMKDGEGRCEEEVEVEALNVSDWARRGSEQAGESW